VRVQEEFFVFWMSGTTLHLRKNKTAEVSTSIFGKLKKASALPLHELSEVRHGGMDAGGTGVSDDEDDDEESAAPCLNRYVALVGLTGTVLEFEVTQRAAEMLIDKFNLILKALDMFEKVEEKLAKQVELA
jgi:hypothetical protein